MGPFQSIPLNRNVKSKTNNKGIFNHHCHKIYVWPANCQIDPEMIITFVYLDFDYNFLQAGGPKIGRKVKGYI